MNGVTKQKKSLFDSKILAFLLSFILAVCAWIIVAYNISPNITLEIPNVPIDIDEKDAAYKTYGLHVEGWDEQHYTKVRVSGARTVVSQLTAASLKVVPNYTAVNNTVNSPGMYTLPLIATFVSPSQGLTVDSSDPGTVTLRFDVAESERFVVEAKPDSGLTVAEGKMAGTIVTNPAEITVSGPETEIANIAHVVAHFEVDGELSEHQVVTTEVTLYDAAMNEIPADNLNLSSETVDVTIPVYTRGVLPLDISFINVPDGFDTSTLEYTLSVNEIEIAADENVIGSLTTKIVGEVDLARFDIGEDYTFPVTLRAGITNLSGVASVTVTFARNNLATDTIRVSEFVIDNQPANYNIEIMTGALNNVTVIGPPEVLEQLLPTSVVAVVDAAAINVERGEHSVFVFFRVPAHDSVFVAGAYTVAITVEPA